MIIDAVRYGEIARKYRVLRTLVPFIEFLERKLGVSVVYEREKIPLGRPDLAELTQLAQRLQEKGIITEYGRSSLPCDEAPVRLWHCHIQMRQGDEWSGGASVENDYDACVAAIAESVERYIWFTQNDYFKDPVRSTCASIARIGEYIAPEKFTAFSDAQRANDTRLALKPDASYLWIRGRSLLSNKPIYIPAQTASASVWPFAEKNREPLIRMQHTIGLATWPTLEGAQLAGINEVIEREAYMVMWFNQLALPRISIASLRGKSSSLDTLFDMCARYNFKIHVVRLLTDAPTHAVCAIVEDMSGKAPRFAFGVKAHRSITRSTEGAILEALRARRFLVKKGGQLAVADDTDKVGHYDRLVYWSKPERAKKLEFLITGKEESSIDAAWEYDTIEQHLKRLLDWCRGKKYECISVDMTSSRSNLTPWSIVMMVLPDLHPTHLTENRRHLGGTRLQEIPKQFGYTPRPTPYIELPHPYA